MNEVKSPKKPLLYYYLLVMLVLLLFNLLAMPWISDTFTCSPAFMQLKASKSAARMVP